MITSAFVCSQNQCPHLDFPWNKASRSLVLPPSFSGPQLASMGSAEGHLYAVLLPGVDTPFAKPFLQKTQGCWDQVCCREEESELVTMTIWLYHSSDRWEKTSVVSSPPSTSWNTYIILGQHTNVVGNSSGRKKTMGGDKLSHLHFFWPWGALYAERIAFQALQSENKCYSN